MLHVEGKQKESENLMLRKCLNVLIKTFSFPTFRQILKALDVEWRNSTQRLTSLPE